MKIAVDDLLTGNTIITTLDEEIVFNQLDDSNEAIWSLLLASGYLRIDDIIEKEGETLYHLSLTNLEIRKEFQKIIGRWFKNNSVRFF